MNGSVSTQTFLSVPQRRYNSIRIDFLANPVRVRSDGQVSHTALGVVEIDFKDVVEGERIIKSWKEDDKPHLIPEGDREQNVTRR